MPTPRTNVGPCSLEGCDRPSKTAGLCKPHYETARRNRTDAQKPCAVEGCVNSMRGGGKGMCPKHYRRLQRFGAVDDSVITLVPGGKEPQPCAAASCDRLEDLRWTPYCSMHGARVRRHGSPDALLQRGRVHSYETQPADECVLYTGKISDKGYGNYRAVWKRVVGPIPEGMQLDHRCRVRACVNVNHLELVTGKENARRRDAAYRYERDNGEQTAAFFLKWDWNY